MEKNKKMMKKKSNKKNLFILILLILISFAVFQFIRNIDYFNIKEITIVGNNKLKKEEILSLSEVTSGQNIFKMNTVKVENRISKSPYIEEINVKRKLPTTVNITIVEKEEVFQMVSSEKIFIILDKDANILKVSNNPSKDVTIINGVKFDKKLDEKSVGNTIFNYINSKRLIEFIKTNEELKLSKEFKEININKNEIDIVLKNDRIVKFGTLKNSNYKLKLLKTILDRTISEKISFEKILMDRGQKPIIVTDGQVITEEG